MSAATRRLGAAALALAFAVSSAPASARGSAPSDTSEETAQPDAAAVAEAPQPEVEAPVPEAPPPAEADAASGERVAVLPLRLTGELPPHVPVIMEVGVVERLRRGGFNVIAPKDVSERSADAATCEDASCWRTIASTNGARYLVRVDVKIVDRDYELALQLIDGTTGEQAADATGLCDLCGHDEVSDMLANKAATLSRAIAIKAATSPTLSVQSEPPGGQVFVDGELAGVAPLELELPPGAHEVRVEKPGFYAQAREVTLVDGVRESVRVELLEVPSAEAKDKERRGRVLRGIGWAGVATGVGALASGAALIAIDQRPITSDCAGENIDINGTCKYRYATLEGGIALTAVGVALAATGIALLVVGRKRERAPSSKVRAQVRATGLQLRF